MWVFCIGYAIFILLFNAIISLARTQWRGWGLIFVSAAIGPIAVVIAAIFLLNAPDADSHSKFWTSFFAIAGFFATLAIGALMSLLVSAYLRWAIERNHPKPD